MAASPGLGEDSKVARIQVDDFKFGEELRFVLYLSFAAKTKVINWLGISNRGRRERTDFRDY